MKKILGILFFSLLICNYSFGEAEKVLKEIKKNKDIARGFNMNILFDKKNFYLFVLFYSLSAIFFALYIEYVLGYEPCKLCIYQRIPYIISIFISFVGYNYFENDKILYLIIITFLLSVLISGYHYGIENNIFEEFSGCSTNAVDIINKEELLKSLKNSTISCKDVNFKLLRFSFFSVLLKSYFFLNFKSSINKFPNVGIITGIA